MKIAISGASGLIGTALCASLEKDGHEVLRLVRRPPSDDAEVEWDPTGGSIDADALTGIDAAVHLAGAGVGDRRWSTSYKREIRDSRVLGTRTLARALAGLDPKPSVFVCGSAIGYYGDTADTSVDETAAPGDGFLANVVAAWEASAAPAAEAGIRVVHPRTGLVVAGEGGAWGKLWPLFRLGAGGRLGGGSQYWSFVSLRDEVRAIRKMLDDTTMQGPYNVTAPHPATNAEITEAMGEFLHRPTFAHVPSFVLKAVLGEMSQEVLGSALVIPARLLESGFTFNDPTIADALRAARPDLVKD
ncbi:MAG: TIGR01777 family oxidoreductase [Actinomycetes bacterium]